MKSSNCDYDKTVTTYIALLRGINVSGQKSIRMEALKKSCDTLGWRNVTTYLQSGNIVFRAKQTPTHKLASSLTSTIANDFAHEVEVIVLPAKELEIIIAANPFWPKLGGEEKHYHATFFASAISEERFRDVKFPSLNGEQFVLSGRVVFLFCPNGYGKTKVNNSFFEKALSVTATTRNWRTVLALQEISTSLEQGGI